MTEEGIYRSDQEASPRSTILVASGRMATVLPGIMNDVVSDGTSGEGKVLSATKSKDVGPRKDESKASKAEDHIHEQKAMDKESRDGSPPTPVPHEYTSRLHYASLTPQQGSGYYVGYAPHQQHMIPESASPAPPHNAGYDVVSFFQTHNGDFHIPSSGNSFVGVSSGVGNTTLSPIRGVTPTVAMISSIQPASPLFPRVASGGVSEGANGQGRGAPNLPYMTSLHVGSSGNSNYQTYPSTGVASHSSDDGAWSGTGDPRNQNSYPSPQIGALGMQMLYGVPMSRATSGGRTYSFDESMLPPAVLDDHANPAYSPYGGSQASGGATLFAHQPSWGYGGPPDPYATPSSPLQPRPTSGLGMYTSSPGSSGMRGSAGPYAQYFPATSPGPPIQTTTSNKGPDGANLFIFHIPNHFTNLDMYQLFTPYGNLLSVRIMVERDTGRSRGFGFVSYDTPEAAAMAIKELNGFPIGNKRLKVQHKQIRGRDAQDQDSMHDSFVGNGGDGYPDFPTLPPSGANANQHLWFDTAHGAGDEEVTHHLLPEPGDIADGNTTPVSDDDDEAKSPLATLGQLQSVLPDVSGNASPE